ncbi:hypothetical protein BJ875DRAFT_63475 [Amylocarpus encephaloides]|uniref:Uncharacterized protein n=1 Tax=Amylocarpus encephaloides TaxID=45428 RepID=A0A9P7YS94_9HELO|nr:hypothetical protein BJ875DRAFT_63475 [Amylocarpus encephaloides]
MASLEGTFSPEPDRPLTDREINRFINANIARQDRFVAPMFNANGVFADLDLDLALALAAHAAQTSSAANAPLENTERDTTVGSADSSLIDLDAALLLHSEAPLSYPISTDADRHARHARVKSTSDSSLIDLDAAIVHPKYLPPAFPDSDSATFAADDDDDAVSDTTIFRTHYTHNPASPEIESIVAAASSLEHGDADTAAEAELTLSFPNSNVNASTSSNGNYNITSADLAEGVLYSGEATNAFNTESSDPRSIAGSVRWSVKSLDPPSLELAKYQQWLKWYKAGNLNVTNPPPVCWFPSDFTYLEAKPTGNEAVRTAAGNALDKGWFRLDCTGLASTLRQMCEEFDVKFGAISFFNKDYEILRAENGYMARLISRSASLAAHALYSDQTLIIPNTLDVSAILPQSSI